jgi:predicted P-loop ATPase/GTPase
MIILLIGKNEMYSGKTTFGRILIKLLQFENLDLIPFKPHSGSNYWFHYNFLKERFKDKKVHSKDLHLLLKGSKFYEKIDPLILNPVHRVFGSTGKITNDFYIDQLFLIRFTKIENNQALSKYYINKNHKGIIKIVEKIKSDLNYENTLQFDTLEDIECVYRDNFNQSVISCIDFLIANFGNNILIESFNDAAYPFNKIEKYIDKLILVSPGKIYSLNKEKYFKKCLLTSKFRLLQLKTRKIIDASLIESEFELAPLNSINNLDIAELNEKYRDIVGKILDLQ